MNNYSAEEKIRIRKQRGDQAIALAMQGKWQEAVEINRQLVALFPDDAEAYNRLGKALVELEQYRGGYEAYVKASELNPANTIAQKNVKRLAHLAQQQPSPATNGNHAPTANPPTRTSVATFIEETGKSGTASLTRLAPTEALDRIIPGDSIILKPEGSALKVETRTGEYIGTVEPKIAAHLLRFLKAGNRYSAAITSVSDKAVKIIIHETYQDPSMFGHPSFTAQGLPAATRPYLRNTPLLNIEEDTEFAYEPEYGEEETETEDETEEVPFEDDDDDDLEDGE